MNRVRRCIIRMRADHYFSQIILLPFPFHFLVACVLVSTATAIIWARSIVRDIKRITQGQASSLMASPLNWRVSYDSLVTKQLP